ncbi:MAG: ATP-binding protein [Ktedonobacterales bacterium]
MVPGGSSPASHMRESGSGYGAPGDAARSATAPRAAQGIPAPCAICGGAGYVRVDVPLGDPGFGKPVPCECKDRQIEERRRSDLRRLSSLDPFLDKTFDTFDAALQGVREGCEAARAFAVDPDGWLVLSGPHGVGKTHLAAAIANYQLAQGNSVFFSIVPDLLDHLRAAFAPSSEVTYDEMFDKVREAGLLVLDDLGAENSTAWATEKLFQLINYRYNFRMPTVITTNVRLLSQMDERIRSRLSDIGLARHVAIKAQDYRERHVGRVRRPSGEGDGRQYGQGRDRR